MKKRHIIELIILLALASYTYLIHKGLRFSLNPLSIGYSTHEKVNSREQMRTSYRYGKVDIEFTKSFDECTFQTNLTVESVYDISDIYIALNKRADSELKRIKKQKQEEH
jgi:1-aminocyclopropane-1-carboxylate deaminase/D-cysteine desulfhydrase-like pyridoxal-dependent ACC family enzyme